MMTAEDALANAVIPRLMAAGADRSRVTILTGIKTDEHDRQFLLAEDLHRLEHAINKIGNVGLVTVDPITAYMGGSTDTYKASAVRAQLGPLKDMAERMQVCVATITHPAKNAGPNALDQFIGSQGFIAACRVGHLCLPEMEPDEDGKSRETGRMLFIVVRHAYTGKIPTLVFRREEIVVGHEGERFSMKEIKATRIIWEGTKDISGNEALAALSSTKPDMQPKVQAWLRELLIDGKLVPAKEIETLAKAQGFTASQLRTASEKLDIEKTQAKGKMAGGFYWRVIEK